MAKNVEMVNGKPLVNLGDMSGPDGNALAVLAKCRKVAKAAGWTDEAWEAFHKSATSADYVHLIKTVNAHFFSVGERGY